MGNSNLPSFTTKSNKMIMKLKQLYLLSLATVAPFALAENGNENGNGNGADAVLFFSDFETESVGDDTSTEPSGIIGLRPLFPGATIRGDETATPFGEGNQFVEFAGANSRVPVHTTAVPPEAYLAQAVMVAFDLYEPDGFGGRTLMGLGSGQWVPEVNFQTEIFAIEINNGFLAGGLRASNVFGALPVLAIEQPYRLFMLMNLSEVSKDFVDPDGFQSSLEQGEMEIWVYDYMEGEYIFGGRWESTQDNIDDTIGFVFRHFSADNNKIYFDDLLIATEFDWAVRNLGNGDPVEPTEWHGYEIDAGGWVDTGDWMGVLFVTHDPWVYSYDLAKWLYIPESSVDMDGGWTFVTAPLTSGE